MSGWLLGKQAKEPARWLRFPWVLFSLIRLPSPLEITLVYFFPNWRSKEVKTFHTPDPPIWKDCDHHLLWGWRFWWMSRCTHTPLLEVGPPGPSPTYWPEPPPGMRLSFISGCLPGGFEEGLVLWLPEDKSCLQERPSWSGIWARDGYAKGWVPEEDTGLGSSLIRAWGSEAC